VTTIEHVLIAILIAIFSGILGKYLGAKNKVGESICSERREGCFKMVLEKIGELTRVVDKLEKAVNSKLLGL
jgi:hypothetical protein